jgi:hypothetical protein
MPSIIVTCSLTIGRRSRLVTLDATHSWCRLAADEWAGRDAGARAWFESRTRVGLRPLFDLGFLICLLWSLIALVPVGSGLPVTWFVYLVRSLNVSHTTHTYS